MIKAEPAPTTTDPPAAVATRQEVLKCNACPYLTVHQERLEAHSHVPPNWPKLNCPGCSNFFYARESLEIHLLRDHKVDPDELGHILPPVAAEPAPTKNRIYIKSVDVLRNPSFVNRNTSCDNSLPDVPQFPPPPPPTDSPQDLQIPMEALPEANAHQQKIYLKNLHDLFQPDYEFQNIPFQSPLSLNFPLMPSEFNDEGTNTLPVLVDQEVQPPKNKIYIRNVQTLIRPDVQKQSELGGNNNTNSSYLHLRSVDDINLMNLEEVQSLPPQRNDIVVLSDFNGEPQPFFPQQHNSNPLQQPPIESPSPGDVEELEQAVINCLEASEELKLLAAGPAFGVPNNTPATGNNNYSAIYRSPVDESSFYYKNLEENISQLIFSTSAEMQEVILEDTVDDSSFSLSQVVTEELEQTTKPTKPDQVEDDLHTLPPPSRAEVPSSENQDQDNVIHREEVDTQLTYRQAPRIFVVNNLTESALQPDVTSSSPQPKPIGPESQETGKTPTTTKKSRGRPKGGRNYGKDDGDFPFECSESGCPRRFNQLSNLEYHKRCHVLDSNDIVCPECQAKDMGSWNNLHTHLWRLHAIDMELYACTMCSFKTPCQSLLKNTHSKIHLEEKAFKCDMCGQLYKNQKQLKNHRRRHRISEELKKDGASGDPQKSVKCLACDPEIQFEDESLLRKHNFQFHRKVRSRCLECQKPFLRAMDLELHMRRNHGQATDGEAEGLPKMFKCDQCAYETSFRNSARRHKMTHSGEKKYSCQFCEYSCIQSKSFRAHLQRVHPESAKELIFKCPQCDYTTINAAQLKFHLAKHGRKEPTASL